jgi:hypothetical protein
MVLVCLNDGCHSDASMQSTSSTEPDAGVHNTPSYFDAGPIVAQPPDGGAACTGTCNYQTQEGCLANEMCSPQVNEAQDAVVPACQKAGILSQGQPCAWGECQPGYLCASDARCHHMCCGGDWSVCATDESCTGTLLISLSDAGAPLPAGVGVCEAVNDCDVFDRGTCPTGKACYIIDSRGGVTCLAVGMAELGEDCSATALCKPSLTCVATANTEEAKCRQLCRATPGRIEPDCSSVPNTVCAHSVGDPPGVGECVPLIAL